MCRLCKIVLGYVMKYFFTWFLFFFPAPRFSQALSVSDYELQTSQSTASSLVQMMNSLIDDVKLSLKDKKHKLKQFQKHHPQLYKKYFSNMVWYRHLDFWFTRHSVLWKNLSCTMKLFICNWNFIFQITADNKSQISTI